MNSDPNGNWCIYYSKLDDRKNWNVMKLQRKDGIFVAAKTYDEAFKFANASDAFQFVKSVYEDPEQKYLAEVKKISRAGQNDFYV